MDPLSPSHINPSWSNSPPTSTSSRALQSPSSSPFRQTTQLNSNSDSNSYFHPSSSTNTPIREPKVFGAPSMGLISPLPTASDASRPGAGAGTGTGEGSSSTGGGGVGGGRGERVGPYLRVKIGGLERNRKDLLVRFDASTNLPNFRTSMYRNMQRSYVEFQRFAEQVQITSPQTIIPALPLASTSAVTDEEDDRLVRIALQRWFTRICEDPVLIKDDELRSFVESDFGYTPVPPPSARRPMTTTSAVPQVLSAALSKVVRRGPLDEDDELQSARGALERLEERWGGAASMVGNLGKARRAMALANADLGAKYVSLSTVESEGSLAQAERKVGRCWEQLSGMGGAQAASENVVLSDSLGYQALNARAAKEALMQRTQLLEDSQTATKSAITKRRNVEKLKGSSSINQAKVDDALHEMEEANNLEASLAKRLDAISKNLHTALRAHSRQTHEDVALALLENARLTVGFHKHMLRELEALKPDLARIGTGVAVSVPTVTPAGPPQSRSHISSGPTPPTVPPMMSSSRPYQSPPRAAPQMDGSKSMFLPPPLSQPSLAPARGPVQPPRQANYPQPQSAPSQGTPQAPYQSHPQSPYASQARPGDPLGGGGGGANGGMMAQSMLLPGQISGQGGRPQAQTLGRTQGRKLDERQAARMLAGGF